MPPKRKRSSLATDIPAESVPPALKGTPILLPNKTEPPAPKRQASRRSKLDTNPDHNPDVVDGKFALRASPDADELGEALDVEKVNAGPKTTAKINGTKSKAKIYSGSELLDLEGRISESIPVKKQKKSPSKSSIAAKKGSDEIKAFKTEQAAKKAAETKIKKEDEGDEWDRRLDPDGDDAGPVEDIDVMKREAGRPPPVNSDYLPLPWKGRLGYVSGSSDFNLRTNSR
jgi:UV DNA damage endonuclease